MTRNGRQVESFRQAENRLLPQNFDYMTLDGLRIEARQKLTAQQPRSIGEASRISGVSPGDVTGADGLADQAGSNGKKR